MGNGKPAIVCPHCEEWIEGTVLAGRKAYRNNFGLDVWRCPKCDEKFKIEPGEYLVIRDQIASGESSESSAISGYPEHEPTPSEVEALLWERGRK